MDAKTSVGWFDKLSSRDFQNGAVLDDIRKRLASIDAALADRDAKARAWERDAIIELCWDHTCKGSHENCDCRGEIITAIREREGT